MPYVYVLNNHYNSDYEQPIDAVQANAPAETGVIPFNPAQLAYTLINTVVDKSPSTVPHHQGMLAFTSNIYPPLCRPYVIFQQYAPTSIPINSFDESWLNASDYYVESLPIFDKYILCMYTRNGDEIVNDVLRTDELNEKSLSLLDKMNHEARCLFAVSLFRDHNDLRNEYFLGSRLTTAGYNALNALYNQYITSDEIKLAYVRKYVNELRRVIRNGPRIQKQQMVFRTVSTDYLEFYESSQMTVRGFTSTTFNPEALSTYAGNKSYKYIYEIILMPGSHAVSMRRASEFPTEYEVLLDYECYMGPLEKREKLLLNAVYPSSDYSVNRMPNAYFNSREVFVVTPQGPVGLGTVGGKLTRQTRRRKTIRKSAKTRTIKTNTNLSLPFWKVRDQSIPRISNDPIPAKEHMILVNAMKAYKERIYTSPLRPLSEGVYPG